MAAKSIMRLKASHPQQWVVGAAQAATTAITNAAAAVVNARPAGFTTRAPATEVRVNAMIRAHEQAVRSYDNQATVALMQGNPPPPPPAPLDLSSAF